MVLITSILSILFVNIDNSEHGGGGLLKNFGDSPSKLLTTIYPNHPWKSWKFTQVPNGYWEDTANLRSYFDDIGKELGMTKERWERAPNCLIIRHKGDGVIRTYRPLPIALRVAYPEIEWSFVITSEGQSYLKLMLESIFHGYNIDENYKHPTLKHLKSNRPIELDLFIPSLNLAFEYQGQQHYSQTYQGNVRRQIERDKEKKELCSSNGITLITIPYYWSGLIEDLNATIQRHHPSLPIDLGRLEQSIQYFGISTPIETQT